MVNFELEAHSFLVRLWQEHQGVPTAHPEWRGWVEHVQSGQRHYFRNAETLREAFQNYIDTVPDFQELLLSLVGKQESPHDGKNITPFA